MPSGSVELLFSSASVLVLLAGVYYAYILSRKTAKATVVWSLLLLLTLVLLLNSVAEVFEFSGGGSGSAGLEAVGESLEHTTLVASSAMFLCVALVLRRSLFVPV